PLGTLLVPRDRRLEGGAMAEHIGARKRGIDDADRADILEHAGVVDARPGVWDRGVRNTAQGNHERGQRDNHRRRRQAKLEASPGHQRSLLWWSSSPAAERAWHDVRAARGRSSETPMRLANTIRGSAGGQDPDIRRPASSPETVSVGAVLSFWAA